MIKFLNQFFYILKYYFITRYYKIKCHDRLFYKNQDPE